VRLKTEPSYDSISDEDLINLVAWCEKWKNAKVYDLAWKESNMEPENSFGDWMVYGQPKLPMPVRLELERGAKINFERGRMWSLQLMHWVTTIFRWILGQSFYAFIALTIAYILMR
jgi:hypothetical protein